VLLWGCATQSAAVVKAPFSPARYRAVKIEPCQDLTGFAGTRNMKEEGTRILTEKVKAMNLFEISTDAPLVLTCDIESFAEGSALHRWSGLLTPTHATVAVIVWEAPGDKMLALLRSRSSLENGGLYTTGADQYILDVSFNDIIKQMEAWTKGSGREEAK
jgi:hypothetical protein